MFVWAILNSVVFLLQTCSASSEAFVRLSVVSVNVKRASTWDYHNLRLTGVDFSLLVESDMSHMSTVWQQLTFHEILSCFRFFFNLRCFLHLPIVPQNGFPPWLRFIFLRDVDFLHYDQIRQHIRETRIEPCALGSVKHKQSCVLLTCSWDFAHFQLAGFLHLYLQRCDGSFGGIKRVIWSHADVVEVFVSWRAWQRLPALLDDQNTEGLRKETHLLCFTVRGIVCNLEEVDVVVSVRELVQVVVFLPQQSDLFLHAIQQDLPPCHRSLLVGSDHLLDLVVLPLDGKQKFGEDALVFLQTCLSRVLRGKNMQVRISSQWCFWNQSGPFLLTFTDSTAWRRSCHVLTLWSILCCDLCSVVPSCFCGAINMRNAHRHQLTTVTLSHLLIFYSMD